MSGFSTGVRGGVDAHAQALGVARLQALERQQAGDLLNGLRAHLGDRDGVLRILHTSSDTKEVKFKSAGSFKRVFISPERLGKAGEAIEHLMRQAGYSDESIEAFSAYRGARGNQGVEVRQVLKHLNLGQPVSAVTPEQALDAAGADRAGARELGAGGAGTVRAIRFLGEPAVYKEMHSVGDDGKPVDLPRLKLASGLDGRRASIDSEDFSPSMPLPGRPRLARTGDVVANWMKDDIKGVVKPLAYVIKETSGADQPPVFHVVPAGKSFKNWATDRLVSHPAGKLEIQGSIQPRAPGRALLSEAQLEATDRGQRASGARRFSEEQLQMIARSGFEAIESGARHGFVFGDIKPENIMTDGSDCKFVDLDALQKVSKQGGEPSLGALTPSYLLPLAFHSAHHNEAHQAGVERDLYAFGMTLVEAALRSARRYDLATSLTSVAVGSTSAPEGKQRYELHRAGSAERAWLDARAVPPGRRTIDQENKVKEGSPLWNDIKSRLGDYPVEPGSALDFGLECLREALHYDSRGKSKVYDPARAGDDHPLKALAQHPTIAAKVAAR